MRLQILEAWNENGKYDKSSADLAPSVAREMELTLQIKDLPSEAMLYSIASW